MSEESIANKEISMEILISVMENAKTPMTIEKASAAFKVIHKAVKGEK